MNTYSVEVTAEVPYPLSRRYRQQATNEGTAVARALKAYRKDVRERAGRTKKINAFTLRVMRERPVSNEEDNQ